VVACLRALEVEGRVALGRQDRNLAEAWFPALAEEALALERSFSVVAAQIQAVGAVHHSFQDRPGAASLVVEESGAEQGPEREVGEQQEGELHFLDLLDQGRGG